jgi:hypothetical protein
MFQSKGQQCATQKKPTARLREAVKLIGSIFGIPTSSSRIVGTELFPPTCPEQPHAENL